MNLESWQKSGQYFEYQQYQIFYKDSGESDKPVLVCLHGFPASSWDWHKVWTPLRNQYRVIAIDMLGFGFSDKPKNHAYSVNEQANVLVSLLNSKHIQAYHLISHDFATLVAQALLTKQHASKAPKMLSLFAMSGSIFPELSNPRLIQKLLISPVGCVISRLITKKLFYKSLKAVYGKHTQPDEEGLAQYWQLMCFKQGHKISHKLSFFLRDRIQYGEQWKTAWQQTNVPICYVAGDDDPMYGKSGLSKLKALSVHKNIISLPNMGHFPHVEAPKAFLEVYEGFKGRIRN